MSQHQETLRQAQSQAFSAAQQWSRARNEINRHWTCRQGNVVRLEAPTRSKPPFRGKAGPHGRFISANSEPGETLPPSGPDDAGAPSRSVSNGCGSSRGPAGPGRAGCRPPPAGGNPSTGSTCWNSWPPGMRGFGRERLAFSSRGSKVIGSLADRIRVSRDRHRQWRSALGLHLQLVLTERPECRRDPVRPGRTNVGAPASPPSRSGDRIPGDPGDLPLPPRRHSTAAPGECDDAVRPLVAALLGRTLLVPIWRPPPRPLGRCGTIRPRHHHGRSPDPPWRVHRWLGRRLKGPGQHSRTKEPDCGTPGIPGPVFRTGRRG